MSANRTLKGITWNHMRGFTPMVATAQRFHELHPDTDIVWHKRSLQEFADKPLAQLAVEAGTLENAELASRRLGEMAARDAERR